jgi:hypothetical protein
MLREHNYLHFCNNNIFFFLKNGNKKGSSCNHNFTFSNFFTTYPFYFHPFLIQGKVKVVGNLFSHPNFQYPQFQSPLIPHPHFSSPKNSSPHSFLIQQTNQRVGSDHDPFLFLSHPKKDRQPLVKFQVLSRSLLVQNIPRVF